MRTKKRMERDFTGLKYNLRVKIVKEGKNVVLVKNKKELAEVARGVLRARPRVVALEGPLGAGKTAFTKQVAKLLEIRDDIVSPTFVLHRQYQGLHHIDCYRMEEWGELLQIGLLKMIEEKPIIVIEWADKFKSQIQNLPSTSLGTSKSQVKIIWVKIEYGKGENERLISWRNL